MDHAQSIRARTRQLLLEQRGGEAIRQLNAYLAESGRHVIGAELERCFADSFESAEQRHRSYADLRDSRGYKPVQVLAAAETLARCEWFAHALALLDLAHAPEDASVAHQRARWAMRLGDYARVVTASELAITSMLRVRMPFTNLLARAREGTAPEALLCFDRHDIARLSRLRMPFVLHWEASHRLGNRALAGQLRDLCLAFWPERRSVWEAAGQHALDDGQPDAADGYFSRALALDPSSITALAGRAIVCEIHKDWHAAATLRRVVADKTAAWQADDAASLHRVIRYAASLGRLDRWREAAPHFMHAWHAGAFRKLAPERGVLLRVFSEELYAPAAVADMLAEFPAFTRSAPSNVAAALRDALHLDQLARRAQAELADPFQYALALGMLAWQAGDATAAQTWFHSAHTLNQSDVVAGCLTSSAAREIKASAGDGAAAAGVLAPTAPACSGTPPDSGESALTRYFMALARLREPTDRAACGTGADHLNALLERVRAAGAGAHGAWGSADIPDYEPTDLLAQLLWWTVLREANVASGGLPNVATRACAQLRRSAPCAPLTKTWQRGAWNPVWRQPPPVPAQEPLRRPLHVAGALDVSGFDR
jgi:tetratricopeptide (TPR) repeat protein